METFSFKGSRRLVVGFLRIADDLAKEKADSSAIVYQRVGSLYIYLNGTNKVKPSRNVEISIPSTVFLWRHMRLAINKPIRNGPMITPSGPKSW